MENQQQSLGPEELNGYERFILISRRNKQTSRMQMNLLNFLPNSA